MLVLHLEVISLDQEKGFTMSVNLVQHAKRELELVGESREFVTEICHIMEHFSSMGHSGASAELTINYLWKLLSHKNLTPLTNDESEWNKIPQEMVGGDKPLWQNNRNSEAFSYDGGKTYWFLSDYQHEDNLVAGEKRMYVSEAR